MKKMVYIVTLLSLLMGFYSYKLSNTVSQPNNPPTICGPDDPIPPPPPHK